MILTFVLDFLGGNKQTNEQEKKTPNFIISFRKACLNFQLVCMKKLFITGNYVLYSILPYLLTTNELPLLQCILFLVYTNRNVTYGINPEDFEN